MEVDFVFPVGVSQLKDIIDEFEQISDSVGLQVSRKLILIVVVFFLLVHDAADDSLETLPWSPNINFTELFHSFEKLCTFDEGLDNLVVFWETSEDIKDIHWLDSKRRGVPSELDLYLNFLVEDDKHVQNDMVLVLALFLKDLNKFLKKVDDVLHELYQDLWAVLMDLGIWDEFLQNFSRHWFEILDLGLMGVDDLVIIFFLDLPVFPYLFGVDHCVFKTTADTFHLDGSISKKLEY